MFFLLNAILFLLLLFDTEGQFQIYVDPLVKNDNNYTGNSTYQTLGSAINAVKVLNASAVINLVSPRFFVVSQNTNITSNLTIIHNSSQFSEISFSDQCFLSVFEGKTLKLILKNIRISKAIKINNDAVI